MSTALKTIFSIALIGILTVGGGFFYIKSQAERDGPHANAALTHIKSGSGLKTIASKLLSDGLIRNALQFRLWARLTGQHTKLRAGEFQIPAKASVKKVLNILESGETVVHKVTLAEGLTVMEMLVHIQDTQGLVGTVTQIPAEGNMLPETYHYSMGDSRQSVVTRMVEAMDELLRIQWQNRPEGFVLATPTDLLTLASIVEKETGMAQERPKVAGVFLNRLKKGMRLQSDPTVVFAITNGSGALGRALSRKDLKIKDAYNTYYVRGLPPGPIANPGRDSILAVLNPAETEALYFVADGKGGHVFANTLKQHNRNVAKWRKFKRAHK